MRDVKKAIEWADAHITEEEEFKFGEVDDIRDVRCTLDEQLSGLIRAFSFGYYVGAHSRKRADMSILAHLKKREIKNHGKEGERR